MENSDYTIVKDKMIPCIVTVSHHDKIHFAEALKFNIRNR